MFIKSNGGNSKTDLFIFKCSIDFGAISTERAGRIAWIQIQVEQHDGFKSWPATKVNILYNFFKFEKKGIRLLIVGVIFSKTFGEWIADDF